MAWGVYSRGMTTDNGDNIEVYDFVSADTLENGDQVMYVNPDGGEDYLENIKVVDEGDSIMVSGLSIVTGDLANYIWTPDQEVALWGV